MNRRNKKNTRKSKLQQKFILNLEENFKYYAIFTIIFLIGLIIGIIFINNISDIQKNEITNHIIEIEESLKEKQINNSKLLIKSIKQNCFLGIGLWIMGSTIIGIIGIVITIGYRGFCFGYTVTSIIGVYGTWKGSLFLSSILLLQNIIFIPTIIAIAAKGTKFCINIVNKKERNIKVEIFNYFIFFIVTELLLVVSSFIEIYISKNIIIFLINYF